MGDKRVVVVGAGPGGLTAAMILARNGMSVDIFEREPVVGGRNAALRAGPYTFDVGPTFLMMSFILREVFELAGRKLEDYCTLMPLDPMYRLRSADRELTPTADHAAMRAQIGKLFPGNEAGFDRFLAQEKVRYEKMYPCLQRPYDSPLSLVSPPLMKALPHLSLGRNLFGQLGEYFAHDQLRTAFTFQAKYLGMSPWKCPAAFTIIPYIEHVFGIDHVKGGLSTISEAMAAVAGEHGARLHVSNPVRRVLTRDRRAIGVELENGERVEADAVVLNADFGHAMATLFEPGVIRRWTPQRLRGKVYSCSTFMLYLGVDKTYDETHHTIAFANDYHRNIDDIVRGDRLPEDMSVYVRNASVLDPTLAPPGHSALYVLVPVPNNLRGPAWTPELTASYRDKVLRRIAERTSMGDLSAHIREERVITPTLWEQQRSVFLGATFNLGHSINQMLYFRPGNRFEELAGCHLVGGGTHPGSGLPTIYESGRISANLIPQSGAGK